MVYVVRTISFASQASRKVPTCEKHLQPPRSGLQAE